MSKIIDFTDVDLYPNRYWVNKKNDQLVFTIRALMIERIENQLDVLGGKKTTLMTGDYIHVNTKFGHNIAKEGKSECWIDVPLIGDFKVIDIIAHKDTGEIELKVR